MALSLSEKIGKFHTSLGPSATRAVWEGIVLQNDGSGDYIKTWSHSSLARPTDAQLAAITE